MNTGCLAWLAVPTPKLARRLRSLSPSATVNIHSEHTGNCLQLERREIRSIQRSWSALPDRKGAILAAYEEIFEHRPDLQSRYKLRGARPAMSALFQTHVGGVGDFLDVAIAGLGAKDPQKVARIARQVGEYHSQVGVPFTAGDLLTYKRAILRQMFPNGDVLDPVYFAWLRLLTFIVIEMKHAMDKGQPL